MNHKIFLRCAAAVLALSLCGAGSGVAATADPIDPLRAAMLQLQQQAAADRERLLWPEAPLVDIDFANRVSGLRPTAATLTIDGAEAARASFTPEQAAALSGGGWYRLAQAGTVTAPRQIHFELSAQGEDAKAAPQSFSADATIDPAGGASTVTLVLERGLLSSPQLRVLTLHPRDSALGLMAQALGLVGLHRQGDESTYAPGGPADPALLRAQYLGAVRDYLGAAAQIGALQHGADADRLDAHYELALSQALLDYGEEPAAEAELAAAQSPRSTAQEMTGLRLNLAAQCYQRGAYGEALQVLSDMPQGRDSPQRQAWRDLKARILLAQGQMSDAAALLRDIPPGADLDAYIRYYNLGSAMVAEGNVAQGLTVLERVGAIVSDNRQLMALSDRANLVAGTHFLKEEQGATAIPLLERVHTYGPYANRAALNLGWAWLASPGTLQTRTAIGDERTVGPPPEAAPSIDQKWDQNLYQRFKLDPFERAKVESSEAGRLPHALAVWNSLVEQPGEDPSIVEGLLAIALKLQQAGARPGAAAYYTRAVAALEATLASLDQAQRYIAGEQAQRDLFEPDPQLGFDREPHALPPPPAADHLSDLMAGWRFRDQLADYRDLRVLETRLDQTAQELDAMLAGSCQSAAADTATAACADLRSARDNATALKPQLAEASATALQAVRQVLAHELQTQQAWAKHLLGDARFELARVYDSAAAP